MKDQDMKVKDQDMKVKGHIDIVAEVRKEDTTEGRVEAKVEVE